MVQKQDSKIRMGIVGHGFVGKELTMHLPMN